ncbi:peptidase inhibitor family I36 protein [Streptomyces sp. MUM 203J]|uniref:peptidase inhibitor family I36 protein n=1 Tax=Streptomyces sp. MUM 203J TaxID=2791990 RepID=UPI001F0370FE|nr:peptidase inhibitor family I36 protein [Streptomyces sp. MUM 203J]MCH0542047.1 peptidase inhibitor family I36 protein [Streptomyces sp. MUM 203J]
MRTTTRTVLTATALTAGALALTLLPAAAPAGAAGPPLGACGSGQLCLWPKEEFEGNRLAFELADTDIESCVPLPDGTTATSFANRTGRPVTTYQSAACAETGEFDTYPGGGTWVPRSTHQVRAFKIWEN